jgi:hypothetical protein
LVTASRDGSIDTCVKILESDNGSLGAVKLWDPRTKEAVLNLLPQDGKIRDCWAVAFVSIFDGYWSNNADI